MYVAEGESTCLGKGGRESTVSALKLLMLISVVLILKLDSHQWEKNPFSIYLCLIQRESDFPRATQCCRGLLAQIYEMCVNGTGQNS